MSAASLPAPCRRCGRAEAPALARPPLPGAAGREIQAEVCAACWQEWMHHEVMVINELRLNFMDPGSQEILSRQMREFLHLPPAAGTDPVAAAEPATPATPPLPPLPPLPPDGEAGGGGPAGR